MKDVNRRKFIKKFVKFLPWLGVGSLIFPASKLINSQSSKANITKISLSSLSYDVNTVPGFFVIRDGQNYKAFSSSCTHLGCELKFDPLKQLFICPCHKSEFNIFGKVLKGPAKRDLDIATIKIEKSEMTIRA